MGGQAEGRGCIALRHRRESGVEQRLEPAGRDVAAPQAHVPGKRSEATAAPPQVVAAVQGVLDFGEIEPGVPAFHGGATLEEAGGAGLNLTAAQHVFHYDRWWNPAVEEQATDRAYRLGQTHSVQVHRLIAPGTLEDRIDAIIAGKAAVAAQVVGAGAGEAWLTELDTAALREILTLRAGGGGGVMRELPHRAAEPVEVIPALFWGEEAGSDAPRGDAGHRGPGGGAMERLTEPSWWQGRPPLLEVLAAVYTAVGD